MTKDTLKAVAISVTVGIVAGILSSYLPATVKYDSIQVGDIYPPILGLKHYLAGGYAYKTMHFDETPVVAYPFTAMLSLYPFSFIDFRYVAPVFCSVVTAIFTYSLLRTKEKWRLLTLLSVPFISAVHAVQLAPVMAAAMFLPCLLPLVSIKPQLGLVLVAAGSWTRKRIAAAAGIVIFSLLLYPSWPIDWITDGNLSVYEGKPPVTQGVGFLLLLCLFKIRDRRARTLLVLSLIPQRLWYDQLMLSSIPETRDEQLFLVIGSWISWIMSMMSTTSMWNYGAQDPIYWKYVVLLQFLPALVIVFRKELTSLLRTPISSSPAPVGAGILREP